MVVARKDAATFRRSQVLARGLQRRPQQAVHYRPPARRTSMKVRMKTFTSSQSDQFSM
jgi:hypothetical protein